MDESKSAKSEIDQAGPKTRTTAAPGGFNPQGVTVFADVKSYSVVMTVNNMAGVRLSVKGARDLALMLRQKANLVERGGR